jgi:glyoxylase-like metal-dependent hydrolase (beta-lactamase superfamily II)
MCFHDAERGILLTGDNVLGLGSVLIDPPEGNMIDYMDSLERMRSIRGLTILFGGHGPAIATPYQKLDEYINHRLERERNILAAVESGITEPKDIVAAVYTDVSPKAYAMAERAVVAHLEKLTVEGKITTDLKSR